VSSLAEFRPFRFATGSFTMTRDGLLADASKAEALGYDAFFAADHLFDSLAPIPMLTAVAEHTRMRLATYVLCNEFHHPVIMAKDAATLDVLSGGRLELGLGGGYIPAEFTMAGIPFEAGAVRFERLAEATQIAKLAFEGSTFSFDGTHYQVREYTPYPRPVQQPRPPLLLGGGGRRLLAFAAAHADIVSVIPASAPAGGVRVTQLTLKSLKDKVTFIRDSAGPRAADLEVNILIVQATVTADRKAAAAAFLARLAAQPGIFALDGELTLDEALNSPYLAFGTEAQIAEHLQRVREETGASYVTVFPHLADSFGPVVSRLANS